MILTILTSSDLHSTHYPTHNSSLRQSPSQQFGGIGKRMTVLKEIREQNENVLVFDCGDFFAGSLFFEEYKGQVDIETINKMKYNAIGIGNHDSVKTI